MCVLCSAQPRSRGVRGGLKKRKHSEPPAPLAEPAVATQNEPVAMGQRGWAVPGGAPPGSVAQLGHPPAWGPYASASQPTSLPQPSGALLGEAQGGAGPAGAGPPAFGGSMQQLPQQPPGGPWGWQPYPAAGGPGGRLQPGLAGAASQGGAPYPWPYAAGCGMPPGWPQGPQQVAQQHPQGQAPPPPRGLVPGYEQGVGQWPVRPSAPVAWAGCPNMPAPGQYLPTGAAPHSF